MRVFNTVGAGVCLRLVSLAWLAFGWTNPARAFTITGAFGGTNSVQDNYVVSAGAYVLVSSNQTGAFTGSFHYVSDGAVDLDLSSQSQYVLSGRVSVVVAGVTNVTTGNLRLLVNPAGVQDTWLLRDDDNDFGAAPNESFTVNLPALPPTTYDGGAFEPDVPLNLTNPSNATFLIQQLPSLAVNGNVGNIRRGPIQTFQLAVNTVFSNTPATISFQGRLLSGTNLLNGPVGLSLRLFNTITGGTPVYEDSNTVAVADGLYTTALGDDTTLGSLDAALTNEQVWLETAVNGVALSPRERIRSVAYARRSSDAALLGGQPPASFATGTPVYAESDPLWAAASNALQAQLSGKADSNLVWTVFAATNALGAETVARAAADGSLSNAIISLVTNVAARADSNLVWATFASTNALGSEAVARIAADGALSNAVAVEVAARVGADASLSNGIVSLGTNVAARADSNLVWATFATTNALGAEAAARIAADGALSNAVAGEVAARVGADASLSNSIVSLGTNVAARADSNLVWATFAAATALTSEQTARVAADGALSNALSAEAVARLAADGSLSNSVVALGTNVAARADSNLVWTIFAPASDLATEASSRVASDAALSNAVNAETAARVAADASFSNRLAATWSITGNAATVAGTHFLGTTDAQPVDVRVQNQRALRLQPVGGSPGVVLGAAQNVLATNAAGASILGGSNNQVGAGADYATIVGGQHNVIGSNAPNALAAGRRAQALHAGAFVWADAQNADFASTATNQFIIRAGGGVGINTNATTPGGLTVAGPVVAASFTGSGSGITGLSSASLEPALATNLALLAGGTQTFSGPVVFSNPSNSFTGNGGNLTNLAAEALTGNSLAWGGLVLVSTSSVGAQPQSVVAADFNGDGKPDLASSAFSDNNVTILTNAGAGRFGLRQTVSVGTAPRGMAAADVNGDGRIDLISANQSSLTLSVMTNNGAGLFTVSSSPGAGGSPAGVAASDFNGDGAPDLATGDFGGTALLVLTNNGTGSFGIHRSYSVASNPFHIVSADVNADGHQDLITANFGSTSISVLTNNGAGIFTNRSVATVGSNPICVATADFNADGRIDLAVANLGGASVSILTNNGTGIFSTRATVSVGAQPGGVATTDLDGDGDLDVLCACLGSDELYVLQNDGTGRFSAYRITAGNGSRFVATGDFDGDGHPDAATADQTASTASIFLNRLLFTGRLAGDGSALTGITGASIVPDSITGTHIVNGTISNVDLAADSVRGSNIVDGAIGTNHLVSSIGLWQNSGGDLVTSGRNVGVGTLLPETEVHIQRGSAGAVTVNASALLALEGTANTMIQFLAPTNAMTGILFGDPANSLRSSIRVNNNGENEMTFRVGDNNTKMIIQSNGFVGIGTTAPTNRLHVVGTVQCTALIQTSDRHAKSSITPVTPEAILEKVAALPVATWRYKEEDSGLHLGPMAQDFHAAFGLGNTDSGIFSVDADGVALAAIQALAKENAKLRKQLEEVLQRLRALETK